MKLFTVQLAKHRQVAALGVKLIDTTVKSGRFYLAPTWDMVLGYKRGELSVDEYTRKYTEHMQLQYRLYRPEWEEVIALPEFAIACYCAPGVFCHRHLLKNIFEKICTNRSLPFQYAGEIGYNAHEDERVPS